MEGLVDMATANTFSICAVRPETNEAGVAVASRCLAVGGLVPFARPGVGAVASQASANPRYGPRGLELLSRGLGPAQVVERLTREDLTVTDDSPAAAEPFTAHGMTT
ncbi:MAG: hypothetical protein AMK72_08355, partial [Planctomycetes bacterium SM23_25]